MSAKTMLFLCLLTSIGFDIAMAAAIWVGKPWWMCVLFFVFGVLSHPGAQPTLRRLAEAEGA